MNYFGPLTLRISTYKRNRRGMELENYISFVSILYVFSVDCRGNLRNLFECLYAGVFSMEETKRNLFECLYAGLVV